MSIAAGEQSIRWPSGDVLHSLSVLGDGIAARLRQERGDQWAAVAWEGRYASVAVDISPGRVRRPIMQEPIDD